jgi:ferredoxin/flavodoxin
MEIKKLHLVYFSPTRTTQFVLRAIAQSFNTEYSEIVEHDVTDYNSKNVELKFETDDLVLFGFPVYSGRVPQSFRDRMNGIKGQRTFSVLIATYGNRDYDDALLEMKNIVKENGFQAIGAAAVVTEHSVIRSVATGRPDAKDTAFIEDFGMKLKKRIVAITNEESSTELYVAGKEPYRKYMKIPIAPVASASCIACGLCVKKCPVDAIYVHNPRKTDKEKCIGCMRCVRICPQNARHVSKIIMLAGECIFSKEKQIRKEPEMFL